MKCEDQMLQVAETFREKLGVHGVHSLEFADPGGPIDTKPSILPKPPFRKRMTG